MENFVGRIDELKILKDALRINQSNKIITLHGVGGVGKSFLIVKFYEEYNDISRAIFIKPIDLSDARFEQDFSLKNRIIDDLISASKEYNFSYYKKLLADFKEAKEKGMNEKFLKDIRKNIDDEFITEFNKISNDDRIVIIFDTYDEKVINDNIDYFIKNIIPVLQNIVFVVAGRVSNQIDKWIKPKEITYRKIAELDDSACYSLIENIPSEYKSQVIALSKKLPLMLIFSDYYFKEKYKTPKVLHKTVSEIENNFDDNIKDYTKELFSIFIDKESKDFSIYVIEMAILKFGINKDILSFLHQDLTPLEINKIIKNLKGYFFVNVRANGNLTIHDNFIEYFINILNPEILKQFTKDISRYYNNVISKSENNLIKITDEINDVSDITKIKELLSQKHENIQTLVEYYYIKDTYAIDYEIDNLDKVILEDIKSSITNNRLEIINSLLPLLKENFINSHTNIKYELARYYRIISKFEDAEQYLTELIATDKNEKNIIDFHQTLSFVYKDQGRFSEAENELIKADKIINQDKFLKDTDIILSKTLNYDNYGQLYTDLGRLSEAIEKFNEGIRFAQENILDKREASLQGNFGLALLFHGELEKAELTIQNAIALNEDLEDEFLVYYNKINLALVEAKKGAFKGAYKIIEEVTEYFSKNVKWYPVVLMQEARIRFEDFMAYEFGEFQHKGNFEEEKKWLDMTYDLTTRSDEGCELYHQKFLAETTLQTANVLLEYAKIYKEEKKRITKNNTKSHNDDKYNKEITDYLAKTKDTLEKAEKLVNDIRIKVSIKEIFAEYYFEVDNNDTISKLKSIVEDIEKITVSGSSLKAYEGEVYYLIAKNHENNNRYEEALSNYNLSIPRLAEPGEWPALNFTYSLDHIVDFIYSNIDRELYDKYIQIFKDNWKDKSEEGNPIPSRELQIINNYIARIEGKMRRKLKK